MSVWALQIDWEKCQSSFGMLDNDIALHPGLQTWGRDHRHTKFWQDQHSICCISVTSDDWRAVTPYRFSYALVKFLALAVLNACSRAEGAEGTGGYLEVQRGLLVEITGLGPLMTNSSAKSTMNASIEHAGHQAWEWD